MEVKRFAVTLGVGMVTGAAVMLMIPHRSPVYRTANHAAKAVKRRVECAMDAIMQ